MITEKIDTAGHWLRPDAAASYRRMIADGMPAGGIASAGRTLAQQTVLWLAWRARRGNRAARPGTSRHETGCALDITRGTPAQVWASAGGDPWRVTPGGSIRANAYGWFRTVPDEPWHFSYDPTRDRRKGTSVVTPAEGEVLLGVANCQCYDGDTSDAAWEARGRLMAAQGRNVWAVTETTAAGRAIMLAQLGPTWKTWTLDGLTVAGLFDSAAFTVRTRRKARFGTPATPFGHGALKLPLVPTGAKTGVDLVVQHTRPGSVATDAQKDADIRRGASLAGKWPAILAGDLARSNPSLPRWKRATPNVDTMDASGDQRVDAAFVRGRLTASNGRVIDPAGLSDHKWLTVDLAFTGAPSPL